jgi:sugar phosphate isomerase/epimerase
MLATKARTDRIMNNSLTDRLAVCSWSLQPADPEDLATKMAATGLRRLQLALDPLRQSAQVWGHAPAVLHQRGLTVVSGMFGCVGEDYTSLERIRRTGGIAPDQTWEENWKNIQTTAALAQQLGLNLVTFHAGFLPHDDTDPAFLKMLQRLAEVADIFSRARIIVGLETGQETAPALVHLLQKLNRPNVGVNFDPANMLLYDKGDPIEALEVLKPWIRQVHIKDARRTKVPGAWGEEVTAGTGEVDWRAFLATLERQLFTGDFVIEREAGHQRVHDICTARELVEALSQEGGVAL